MEYKTSATPSSPDDTPIQDNISAARSGTDRSGTDNSGTDRTRVVPLGAAAIGAGTVGAAEVRAPARPRGPNASAIIIGLVAMLFAGLIIAKETMNWRLDWSRLGPGSVVGIGVVMVVIGAIGLIRRNDDT